MFKHSRYKHYRFEEKIDDRDWKTFTLSVVRMKSTESIRQQSVILEKLTDLEEHEAFEGFVHTRFFILLSH